MPDDPHEAQSHVARGETAQSEFDRFFENTPSPMIVAGFDGYMQRVNAACESLAGLTDDELRAAPFANFIHPDDRETAEIAILEMAASGVGRNVDVRVLCKDGSFKWTEWSGTPFTERQTFYLIGKDVTDRHNVQEDLKRRLQADEDLERFFVNAPDVMFVGGYDGYSKRINAALEALTGFTSEQLMAEPTAAFAHPDERDQVAAEIQNVIAGGTTRGVEFRLRCADGSYKRVLWNASNFADLGVYYAIGTDVTERRLAEESLAKRAKQQEAAAELGQYALAGGDLTPLMLKAAALLARTLGAEFAEIRELLPSGRETILKAGYGWDESPLAETPLGVAPDTVSGYMLSTGEPALFEDLVAKRDFMERRCCRLTA